MIAPPLRKLPRPQWLHLLSSHIGPEVASLREPLWEPIEPFEVGGEGARAREDQPCPCRVACMCGFHQASSEEDDSICPPALLSDLMWTSCVAHAKSNRQAWRLPSAQFRTSARLGNPRLNSQSPQQIQTRPELALQLHGCSVCQFVVCHWQSCRCFRTGTGRGKSFWEVFRQGERLVQIGDTNNPPQWRNLAQRARQ